MNATILNVQRILTAQCGEHTRKFELLTGQWPSGGMFQIAIDTSNGTYSEGLNEEDAISENFRKQGIR